MGDINVDMSERNNTHTNYDHVQELSDVFNLTNLIKQTTCFTPTATRLSLIDIILTNRPRSFQSSVAIETGLMSQSIPTGYIPPGSPRGLAQKHCPGGSGFDF